VRVAVTGGAGFIGSHVVDALVARGDEVHAIDDLSTGRRENLNRAAQLHERDIREPLDSLCAEIRPEVVVHLAAQADVGTSVERPVFDAEVNVIGTVNVLEAARAHGAQVVFSSSGGAIYGECERPAREDDERRPLSPYGASKLAGEAYLSTWNALHGTRHVSLRFGNVFGPRQLPKLEGGVVAIFVDRLRAGEQATIYGDGEQVRDFVYVGDVVAAVLAAFGRDGGTFNVGTGRATSVNQLFDACRRAAGVEAEVVHADARPGDLVRSVLDVSRAEAELGWRARSSLEEGLRATWDAGPGG
jgi:UDP-glucose 4-epimerase